MRPAIDLLRLTLAPTGLPCIGAGPGRGAWLCRDQVECLERALRSGALDRALRTRLAPAGIEILRANLAERASMGVRVLRGNTGPEVTRAEDRA